MHGPCFPSHLISKVLFLLPSLFFFLLFPHVFRLLSFLPLFSSSHFFLVAEKDRPAFSARVWVDSQFSGEIGFKGYETRLAELKIPLLFAEKQIAKEKKEGKEKRNLEESMKRSEEEKRRF